MNDSASKEELIFVLPWTCNLQLGKRIGELPCGMRAHDLPLTLQQEVGEGNMTA